MINWRTRAPRVIAASGVVLICAGIWGCSGQNDSNSNPGPQNADARTRAQSQLHSQPEQKLRAEFNGIMALIRARRTADARATLEAHINEHPSDGQACFLLGLTYHREKKYGEARPWFEKALTLEPAFALAHYFLGWALYWLGELPAAKAQFDTYLVANPNEHDSHFALGLICLDEDDLDCAERLFKRSIELVQQFKSDDKAALSRTRARLGEVYDRRGQYAEARSELEQAVTLYPDHYEALYKFYRVLVRLGETERAEQVHKQYLETRERLQPGTRFPE